MENCQNNMRWGRQGNMYSPRAGYNMPRNSSRMDSGAQRRMNSNTCGCREEQRSGNRMENNCGNQMEKERECRREERRMENCRPEERRMEKDGGCKTECSQECRKTEECNRREEKKSCGCHREDALSGLPLAMAYVPWQEWRKIYDVCEGFHRGTIFEELDLPFRGKGGCNR